jgi:hypothetical protein
MLRKVNKFKNRRGAVEMMEAAAVICLCGLAILAMGPIIKSAVQGKLRETSNDFSKNNISVNNHELTDECTTTAVKRNSEDAGVVRNVNVAAEVVDCDLVSDVQDGEYVNVGASAQDEVLY